MKDLAVIGDPVAHSLSPAMHNPALKALGLNAVYKAFRVTADDLPNFVRSARETLSGFNITVPHKRAIVPFLDRVDAACERSNSVNTVRVAADGTLSGTSTDGYGLAKALEEAFGANVRGLPVLFVGCGGAAQAVAWSLLEGGAASAAFFNRSVDKAETFVGELARYYPNVPLAWGALDDRARIAAALERDPVIIQSTSVGLKPSDPCPFPPELLRPGLRVYDMIYGRTALLKAAEKAGCAVADGRGMLLWQGARSLEIWTGQPAPIEIMRKALNGALAERTA